LVVWRNARRTLYFRPVKMREIILTVLFACIAGGLGVYCYRHLPLIDFLPYKVGVNLYDAKYGEMDEEQEARMIYRDLSDGSTREFAVSDTTWYDTTRWEFVEMVEQEESESGLSLREFTVLDSRKEDATSEIVGSQGRVYMLCASKLDLIKPRCVDRFEKVVRRAYEEGASVVLLTASPIAEGETRTFGDTPPVEIYNVDGTTMITMLRASVGMVVLDGGVITDKRNWRDI
jgi:hypothetical protein